MRVEGKAREEIILQLLDNKFIRVRLYPNKCWSVSAKEWDFYTKKGMAKWAEQARNIRVVGKYMNVVVATYHRTIRNYTVEELYLEKHLDENELGL